MIVGAKNIILQKYNNIYFGWPKLAVSIVW